MEQLVRNAENRSSIPKKLAYVEWYTKLRETSIDSDTGMHILSNAQDRFSMQREVEIISIADILLSAHLIPIFPSSIPEEWTSSTILDSSPRFLLNIFKDRMTHYIFQKFDHSE